MSIRRQASGTATEYASSHGRRTADVSLTLDIAASHLLKRRRQSAVSILGVALGVGSVARLGCAARYAIPLETMTDPTAAAKSNLVMRAPK